MNNDFNDDFDSEPEYVDDSKLINDLDVISKCTKYLGEKRHMKTELMIKNGKELLNKIRRMCPGEDNILYCNQINLGTEILNNSSLSLKINVAKQHTFVKSF